MGGTAARYLSECHDSMGCLEYHPMLLLHEVFGGLESRAEHFLYELADLAARPGARDSTRYTRCARGFVQYHLQRISLGIIKGGALGMWDELQKLRRAHAPRAA